MVDKVFAHDWADGNDLSPAILGGQRPEAAPEESRYWEWALAVAAVFWTEKLVTRSTNVPHEHAWSGPTPRANRRGNKLREHTVP